MRYAKDASGQIVTWQATLRCSGALRRPAEVRVCKQKWKKCSLFASSKGVATKFGCHPPLCMYVVICSIQGNPCEHLYGSVFMNPPHTGTVSAQGQH